MKHLCSVFKYVSLYRTLNSWKAFWNGNSLHKIYIRCFTTHFKIDYENDKDDSYVAHTSSSQNNRQTVMLTININAFYVVGREKKRIKNYVSESYCILWMQVKQCSKMFHILLNYKIPISNKFFIWVIIYKHFKHFTFYIQLLVMFSKMKM